MPDTTPGGAAWPRLTVVTPSYNQGEFLEATIRSVLLQGYPDLEYIIVDGGSDDGSKDVLDKYGPWLAYAESGPDEGQYDAINKGFARSSGAVMTWLNSDDMLALGSLWAVGGIFGDLGQTVDWLTGVPAMWDRDGHLTSVLPRPKLNRRALRLGAYDGVTLHFIQQEGSFWSRDLWLRAGGYVDAGLSFAADYELWCRFADHADLYGAAALLAGFRRHPRQKTATAILAYMEEMQRCRLGRSWGSAEKHWLTRGIKRRFTRLLYRTQQERTLVVYDLDQLHWTILEKA